MEVLFRNKKDAVEVLERLKGLISQYDYVAVNDLKQLLGQQVQHLGRSEGWFSLDEAKITKADDNQWALKLPDPEKVG